MLPQTHGMILKCFQSSKKFSEYVESNSRRPKSSNINWFCKVVEHLQLTVLFNKVWFHNTIIIGYLIVGLIFDWIIYTQCYLCSLIAQNISVDGVFLNILHPLFDWWEALSLFFVSGIATICQVFLCTYVCFCMGNVAYEQLLMF